MRKLLHVSYTVFLRLLLAFRRAAVFVFVGIYTCLLPASFPLALSTCDLRAGGAVSDMLVNCLCCTSARFQKVAAALGEAIEVGMNSGDRGAWVWKPAGSKSGLGPAAHAQLQQRLHRITVDARKVIEKV